MNVGDCIRRSIDDWHIGELDSSMMHACNAVDGTARKAFPAMLSSAKRFKMLLRENYDILGPMGAPSIDIEKTRWPIKVAKSDAPDGGVDIADVLYGVHRCCHNHGEALPEGFELRAEAHLAEPLTTWFVTPGTLAMSERMIFALLAVAVFSPANIKETVPDGYHFSFGSTFHNDLHYFLIKRWWGRRDLVAQILAVEKPLQTTLNFEAWTAKVDAAKDL